MGGARGQHPTWVANNGPDGILGMDFIRAHSCEIRCRGGMYELADANSRERVEPSRAQTATCCRFRVKRTTVVPPRSEVVVLGRLQETPETDMDMVLEPRAQFVATKKLLLAKTVVSTAQGTVPLRVLNPTDEACTVHEDTFAAIAEPATEVSPWEQRNETVAAVSPTNQSANNKPPNGDQREVPSHLTDLLGRSIQH